MKLLRTAALPLLASAAALAGCAHASPSTLAGATSGADASAAATGPGATGSSSSSAAAGTGGQGGASSSVAGVGGAGGGGTGGQESVGSAVVSSASSASSASSSGGASPDAGSDAGCTPGARGCDGAQPEVCDASGAWQPSGFACGVFQACSAGACQNAATAVTTPPCNAPSYAQLPGNGNALFISREQNAQLESPPACTSTSNWHLVLSTMDWTSSPPALSITNHALFATSANVTIASGQQVASAYDASIMSYGGEIWVAFECAIVNGQTVSSCVGPLVQTGAPSAWYVDPKRTNVVVSGMSTASASVPKLVVFGGSPYLYYTTVLMSGGSWTGAPTRGIALSESAGASGNVLWPKGTTAAVSALDASSVEVLAVDPNDPISSGYADASGVSTDGTYLYMMGGLGGDVKNGCVIASGGLNPNVAGCYRMFVSRASTPLTPLGFNEYRIAEYLLPANSSQYPRVILNPANEPQVMGSFYAQPTNVPANLPTLPQAPGGTWGQWIFPFDPSTQSYELTYAQWSAGNWQLTSNQSSYFPTYWLTYQSDGNFVMYDYYDNPLWDIGHSSANYCVGAACTFTFQGDGNLVAYQNGVAYWESETNGKGAGLRFTSTPEFDYHAVIWNSAQTPIWQK